MGMRRGIYSSVVDSWATELPRKRKKSDSRYGRDRSWADKFIPEARQALGAFFVDIANELEDVKHNTDLIVLAGRIAMRVRRFSYVERYFRQFTFRMSLPSGASTELEKVIAGWGDYFFYGFADEEGKQLYRWVLLDLDVFREAWGRGARPMEIIENKDESSKFAVFSLGQFGDELIVAEKKPNRETVYHRKKAVQYEIDFKDADGSIW